MLSDENPFAPVLAGLAQLARENRKPAAPENPFIVAQEAASRQIVSAFDSWGKTRDSLLESIFFSVYGSPLLQASAGVDAASEHPLRKAPKSSLHRALVQTRIAELKSRIKEGGLQECTIRGLLYAGSARGKVDERGVNALRGIRLSESKPRLTLAQFKAMAREQFYMLLFDREATLEAIPGMLPADMSQRRKAFDVIKEVLAASQDLTGETAKRLRRVEQLFGLDRDKAATAAKPAPAEVPKKVPKAKPAPPPGESAVGISGNGRTAKHENRGHRHTR
jgi:hypothetical protein